MCGGNGTGMTTFWHSRGYPVSSKDLYGRRLLEKSIKSGNKSNFKEANTHEIKSNLEDRPRKGLDGTI